MSIVGRGVQEIRVHSEGEWRVIHAASLPAAVYVLHAFGKKSQRTNPLDIASGSRPASPRTCSCDRS